MKPPHHPAAFQAPASLSPGQQNQVYELWDRLAAFPVVEIDLARQHLLRTISCWIGATQAGWIGMVRLLYGGAAAGDPLHGWRSRIVAFEPPVTSGETALARKIIKAQGGRANADMASRVLARQSGTFRAHLLRDGFVDLAAYEKTPHYEERYRKMGVMDRMWVLSPIGPSAESCVAFDVRHEDRRFSGVHLELAAFAIRGLTWFQRDLLCSHGLGVTSDPLTPTEREVMLLLLTSKSEKQIALDLGQSPHTTHDHIQKIYRKFQVQSRAGLMALWLSYR